MGYPLMLYLGGVLPADGLPESPNEAERFCRVVADPAAEAEAARDGFVRIRRGSDGRPLQAGQAADESSGQASGHRPGREAEASSGARRETATGGSLGERRRRAGIASGAARRRGSAAEARPWEREGISRATWYRRRET